MFEKIGETTWTAHEGGWLQKRHINKSGKPVYAYHYQSKYSKPGITIEINTKLSRQYCGYILIEKDLDDTLHFIDALSALIEKKSARNDFLIKGMSRAIVTTYGKCFAKADGRRTKLERKNIPDEFKEVHDKLIDMRNNYAAHAGISLHEACRGIFVLPPENKAKKPGIVSGTYFSELRQTLTHQILTHEATRRLIKNILAAVKQRLIKTCSQLQKQTNSLDLNKLYRLAKKRKSKHIILNDDNMKVLCVKKKSTKQT